jgi:Tfp pilus assembly protein PilV
MNNQEGQSLIEVIVAVGMMALLLVSLLALITISIKNSRLAQNRAQAVSLSQGGVELMRAFRDFSWTGFLQEADSTNYQLPQNWVVEDSLGPVCDTVSIEINGVFSRCVTLSLSGIDTVEVLVTTYWADGSQTKTVTQTTRLSKWER